MRYLLLFPVLVFMIWLVVAFYQSRKPLPEGLYFSGPVRTLGWEDVSFLCDRTDRNLKTSDRRNEREIYRRAHDLIAQAEKWIVADFFLINDWAGEADITDEKRPLSQEFMQALIDRKTKDPAVEIILITDPLNTLYGALEQPLFQAAEQAGIQVVLTDLTVLRDSNLIYSPFWRVFLQWWGSPQGNTISNPVGPGSIGLPALLEMLNFKANHRKVLLVDAPEAQSGMKALITSANPHSASAMHSNVAVEFSGGAVADLLETEEAVYRMSTGEFFPETVRKAMHAGRNDEGKPLPPVDKQLQIQVLTEKAIKEALLKLIETSGPDDRIQVAMFYFSDMDLASALGRARERGSRIQVLLDPNKDAFGRPKNGIPNRQVAARLESAGVDVRWYQTGGEQFHSKMALFRGNDGTDTLVIGSANWTRRNLDNYNLETNVLISGSEQAPVFQDAVTYFEDIWMLPEEKAGAPEDVFVTSVEYDQYEDRSRFRKVLYWIMERSGASTF